MARPKKEKKTKQSANAAFFDKLAEATGNALAKAASTGISAGDVHSFIDTGVYLLNAQLSGSIHGGCPDNKIVVFAGPEATGKTFFVLSIVKHFLETNPEAAVFYFESESAIDKSMLEQRGIDTSRVYIVPVSTVQEWRTQSLKLLKIYSETSEDDRRPMMFVLDSLGMLSTSKEMEDSESGSETKDMTRAGLIKAAFRTLTLKLGTLNVPLLVTNHTYEEMGKMFAQKKQSGGSGILYSNSITVFLSKAKEKIGDEIVGALLTCTLKKGRLTRENTMIKVRLDYSAGLDRYYGLLDLASEAGLVKKIDKKYEFADGTKAFENHIYKNPKQYFEPLLEQLEVAAGNKFRYGSAVEISNEDAATDDELEEEE
jgi:RecA/RadA recombinase